jgi:oligopeptide/dipeptide ABC transporter ATP-binding protein
VETAATGAIMARPLHPYTQRLFSSVPDAIAGGATGDDAAGGDVPTREAGAAIAASGPCCPYCGQCSRETARCREAEPQLRDVGGGHLVACWEVH